MKRIICHWTASGTYSPNHSDLTHYHMVIDGDGRVHQGNLGPEANVDCSDGIYVRHTRGCNTGAIGIGICAMHGAQERPFDAGQYPIKPCQIDALVAVIADLCETYEIPVNQSTVLTHAEVQPTLGIRQRGKWDITWLPNHIHGTDDSIRIGDILRARVMSVLGNSIPVAATTDPVVPEVTALIEEADDRGSKSIAATITQFGAAASAVPVAVFADFDTTVILAMLASITVLTAVYLFTSRRSKGRAARRARAALC